MRVLHLYGGNLYGGIERNLAALARERAAAPGLEQRFGLCYAGRLARELERSGVEVLPLGGVRVSRPWQVAQARRRLRQLLAERPADAVVTYSCWIHAIFSPGARAAGVPVAFWVHDDMRGKDWLERWAGRHRPDRLLALSGYIAQGLERSYPGLPAAVVHPLVAAAADCLPRAETRRALGVAGDRVVILQASRLEPWKGHGLHLKALALLPRDLNWECWMAGGAQRPHEIGYLARLQAEAARLGLGERVRWLGQRDDVGALMAASDIFCQPNEGPEPFGIVFVEALQQGLPVVSTRMGGAAEIVTAGCGRLAAPGDAAGLAELLRELVADPQARRRDSAASRQRARELCDPARQLGRLEAELKTLAARGVAA